MPRKVSAVQPAFPEGKAGERIVARFTEELKRQLMEHIDAHPHFQGNISEWVNACAQAWIVQSRTRGRAPVFPVEFVTKAQVRKK